MEVPFIMLEFSRRKIIMYLLHVYTTQGDKGIIYDVIICHDLMVQLGLKSDFGHQVLEWDETVVHMKNTGNFLG